MVLEAKAVHPGGMPKPASLAATRSVALLRGINVGGNKKVPMAALRELAEGLGWRDVVTYIQSGNLVFRAKGTPVRHESALEAALLDRFGFSVPVVVRSGTDWLGYAQGGVFPDAEVERPTGLHLALTKAPPHAEGSAAVGKYCTQGERVVVRGDAIWIDYRSGVGSSKLTPAVLDRAFASSVTARNWKTVQALATLLLSPGVDAG